MLIFLRKYSNSLFVVMVLLSYHGNVFADIDCRIDPSRPALTNTVTLNGSYYIGREIPVGTVIYKVQVVEPAATGIYCDAPFSVPRMLTVNSEPSGGPFSAASPFSGQIYPTNVPGIGVSLSWGNVTFTKNTPLNAGSIQYHLDVPGYYGFKGVFELSLIKTGDVTPGEMVNGISIPSVIVYAGNTTSYSGIPGYTGLPLTVDTFNFNGNITFTGGTCQTPSYTVEMGSYDIKRYFTQPGSTTPWVDASIKLTNCPTFTGYHSNDSGNNQQVTGTGIPGGTTVKNNSISVSITPGTPFLDVSNGIFALQNSDSAASGIGFQLGYSDISDGSAIPPTDIWTNNARWSVDIPVSLSGNLNIPLAVRYYQTEDSVTPGVANSFVTYTLDYF
jgi:P pilus assembly protein, pilin FimA